MRDTQNALDGESDDFMQHDLSIQLSYFKAIIESDAQLQTRLPNITFDTLLTISGSKRQVELLNIGEGHTPGDCIMLLPNEHIAFVLNAMRGIEEKLGL